MSKKLTIYKEHWGQWIPIIGLWFLYNMNKNETIYHVITTKEMFACLWQGLCIGFFLIIYFLI